MAQLEFDAIVLGAGGAGLMCAVVAGQHGKRVLVVDHNHQPGRKILISGGGRCNFTNLHMRPENFVSENPHFAISALKRYQPQDIIALVEKHGICWHEKTLGQLFCNDKAQLIVTMLMDECARGAVSFRFGQAIGEISHGDDRFKVVLGNDVAQAKSLVIATGGPAIPKLGASGFAYQVAAQFGLKIVTPRPGLVPLQLAGDEKLFHTLSGVAIPVIADCGSMAFREAALFTHRGLSGPAILQISNYWREGDDIMINFTPDAVEDWLLVAKKVTAKIGLTRALAEILPSRLAAVLAERIGLMGELANMADDDLRHAQSQLAQWRFHPSTTAGFAKAEVAAGGISTDELSSRSMAAKKLPGLYVIGEAVDVTGWLGGYNFHWAWASGQAAGLAVAQNE